MKISFETVSVKPRKNYRCECGKKGSRTKTFMQTINPFNKNADGFVKTRDEIIAELSVEAKAWMLAPEKCNACAAQDRATPTEKT